MLAFSRRQKILVIAATVLLHATLAAAQTRITCESDGGYKYCGVETHGKAVLVKELSAGVCEASTNWAFDRRGIWVDKGCKGEFEVNDTWPGGKPGGLTRPAPDPKAQVPAWAVGTFKGTVADWNNEDFTITIEANGIATLVRGDGTFYGKWVDGIVRVPGPGGMTYGVKKKGDGIEITALANRMHRVIPLARAK